MTQPSDSKTRRETTVPSGPAGTALWQKLPGVRVFYYEEWVMIRGPLPWWSQGKPFGEGGHSCEHMQCPPEQDDDSTDHVLYLAKDWFS